MFDSNPHRVAVNPCIIKSEKLKSTSSYLLAVCLPVSLVECHLVKLMKCLILISLSQSSLYKSTFFLSFYKEQYLEGCCFFSLKKSVAKKKKYTWTTLELLILRTNVLRLSHIILKTLQEWGSPAPVIPTVCI